MKKTKKQFLNLEIHDVETLLRSYTAARPGGDGGGAAGDGTGSVACGGCHGTTSPEGQAANANLAGAIAGGMLAGGIGGTIGGAIGGAIGAGIGGTGPCPCD